MQCWSCRELSSSSDPLNLVSCFSLPWRPATSTTPTMPSPAPHRACLGTALPSNTALAQKTQPVGALPHQPARALSILQASLLLALLARPHMLALNMVSPLTANSNSVNLHSFASNS